MSIPTLARRIRTGPRGSGVAAGQPGFDAYGMRVGCDRILEVDHKPLMAGGEYREIGHLYTQDSLTGRVAEKKGAPVVITVLRHGKKLDVTITPTLLANPVQEVGLIMDAKLRACCNLPIKHTDPRQLLGLPPSYDADVIDVGIGSEFVGASESPVQQTRAIGSGIYHIFTGEEKADPD